MNIESFREFCMQLNGVAESQPFGPDTLVYKVGGKIFALAGLDDTECSVNLKCDPERAIEFREEFPDDIMPGYHMNKKHWNTIYFERGLKDDFLKNMIHHSYDLVVSALPLKIKKELQQSNE